MVAPVGISTIQRLLHEVKKNDDENIKNNRQQSNEFFDNKISHLNNQVDLLKEQAGKIGRFGVFNALMSLAQLAMNIGAGFLPGMQAGAQALTKMLTQTLIKITETALNMVSSLVNSLHEKVLKTLDAKIAKQNSLAEVATQFYTHTKDQQQEAIKKSQETMADLKEVRNDLAASQEAMVRP